MRPVTMFDGKQTGDVMLSLSARLGRDLGSATFHDHLRAAWGELRSSVAGASDADGADDAWWRGVLRSGVLPEVAATGATQSVASASPELRSPDSLLTFDLPEMDGEGMDFTLLVYPSSRLYDGRFANRPLARRAS